MRIMEHLMSQPFFAIPGLIFQAKVTKFGTNVVVNMLISTSSGFFSCDQAALWMVQSVHPSVCPSVTPFHHVPIIVSSWNFWGVITNDKSDIPAKGQGQRSEVKVTEVKTQFSRFWTITPVWIHILWWNDAQILMLLRRSALLLFKVIRQISRSHGTKKSPILTRIERFQTVT